MPRPKITNADKQLRKIKMLKDGGFELPLEVTSQELFSKLKKKGYTRYQIVIYVLGITHTAGRRMDLGNRHMVRIDEQLNVSIKKLDK